MVLANSFSKMTSPLTTAYQQMRQHSGHRGWWPGENPFEICVGAILTQNTNWQNVERAIQNLKRNRALNLRAIHKQKQEALAQLIRPAGYYNVKAKRLKAFVARIMTHYRGSLNSFFQQDTQSARKELLAVRGIGPETADSILLYAGNHPTFVVDAYTKRIFARHHWIEENADYHQIKTLCETQLANPPQQDRLDYWQDYHAQIVNVGKNFCRPQNPQCDVCPLESLLPAENPAFYSETQSPPRQNKWMKIAPSSIHHLGAFACRRIPKETQIARYFGKKISKKLSAQRLKKGNAYIFCLNEEVDVDGDVPNNLAKYLNHSCSPNCETRQIADEIQIYSLMPIAPGEEITINYGYGLEDYSDHPCRCGAANCAGYIVAEAFFDHVRKRNALNASQENKGKSLPTPPSKDKLRL